MKFILRIILNGAALLLVSYIYPALQIHGDTKAILISLLIFGIANTIIKPIAKALSVPLKIITLGLATIFINIAINILLFWGATKYATAVSINGGTKELIIAALIYGIITWVIQKVL
jgi:putative membrane protein